MKNILILLISVLTMMPVMAQTQEDIEVWSQKGYEFYEQGNFVEAVKWWHKAAEQGDAKAQLSLGLCYKNGEGVPQNHTEAVKWWRKAAEQDYAVAQFFLGLCYDLDQGVPQNYAEAVKWYRKAAEQGYADAQLSLGLCYKNGEGVPQNHTEAVKWWRKAAEQDHAVAQYSLGVCYDLGQGVPQNHTEAVKWWRKAAEQDYAVAQYSLGVCYDLGQGVPQNYAEAVKWYRKAAEQGDADAQYSLGVCYESGEGVPQNYVEAMKWYRKATELGHKDAKERFEQLKKAGFNDYNGYDEGGINIDDLKPDQQSGGAVGAQKSKEEDVVDNAVVEIPACYPGGEAAILAHIAKSLKYPEIAIEEEIQGVVTLRFKVEKDGSVGIVTVAKGLYSPDLDKDDLVKKMMKATNLDKKKATDIINREIEARKSCDQAAVAVVKTLQRFIPAKHKGKPVAVWFTLPIRFSIQ